MIKKIPVSDLKVGVFVEKIDQGWLSTPFLSKKFKITSEKQIQKFKEYDIHEVHINTEKGLDVVEDKSSSEEQPAAAEIKERRIVDYMDFPSHRLVANTVLPFDLYIKKENQHELYLPKGLPYHSEIEKYLESSQNRTAHILPEDKGLLEKYEKSVEKEKHLSEEGLAPGFESGEKVRQYNNYLNNYMPVNAEIFVPGVKTPVHLYLEKDTAINLVLEAGKAVPENEIFGRGLNGSVRRNLLIYTGDRQKYQHFLKEMIPRSHSGSSEEAVKMRTAIIKENSKVVSKELMDNPRSGEAVKEAKNTVSDLVENILENSSSFYSLMKINSYDYYTYVHSLNVCTLSISLGHALGLKKNDLNAMAIGALIHDVGKSQVPKDLINKPGKLTVDEFEKVKRHVKIGSTLMQQNTELPQRSLIPLLQHHEKLNGTGYPKKLRDDKIHIFGRIASIVDVYDALTTERSYKKAFKPFEAASILAKSSEEYDQEVFRNFVSMLGKQNKN